MRSHNILPIVANVLTVFKNSVLLTLRLVFIFMNLWYKYAGLTCCLSSEGFVIELACNKISGASLHVHWRKSLKNDPPLFWAGRVVCRMIPHFFGLEGWSVELSPT